MENTTFHSNTSESFSNHLSEFQSSWRAEDGCVCFHLYEVVSAEHRHGVGVLLLLLQQLSGESLLMQQEALLLHDV